MMYCLEYKEPYAMPNILGGHSMPVHTYRWKQVVISNDKEYLQNQINKSAYPEKYRIVEMPGRIDIL